MFFVCFWPTETWRVSWLSYFISFTFHFKGNSLQLWNVPLEAEPWTRFRAQLRIRNKELSNVVMYVAGYSTPVSFNRNGSRRYTATRKMHSSVMRPVLHKPNAKLNLWSYWNVISKGLLTFVKDVCIQDWGRNYTCIEVIWTALC